MNTNRKAISILSIAVACVIAHPEKRIEDIALVFGVPQSTLFAYLKRSKLSNLRTNNKALNAASAYAFTHPDTPFCKIVAKFGVCRSSLQTRLRKAHLPYTTTWEAKRSAWTPMLDYAAANPTISVKEVAAKFGVTHSALIYAMTTMGGTSRRDLPPPKLRCRRCGETDHEKFSKCSRYRSGYQGLCKTCARGCYLTSKWGGKHRQRVGHLRKLTDEQVREIKRLYSKGVLGYGKIGKLYNVSSSATMNIVKGKTYKHITQY